MFTNKDIIKVLKAQPFRPFRVHLTDGAKFDVRHPDQAIVTRQHMVLATSSAAQDNGEGDYDDYELLAIIHITHIAPLKQRSSPRRRT